MKKLIALAVVLSAMSSGAFAANAHQAAVKTCKAQASKDHIAKKERKEYVKQCVEKHMKEAETAAPAAAAK